MVEIQLLPLQAASLFPKVPSLAREGFQIYLGTWGVGVEATTATNPGANPLSTFETKMATRNAKCSTPAILRKIKGLWTVKLY